ncbi:T9SS type A sorting domain-containing protein [candidate division WOR-3 bacterium]|nr:T9SS type A sorting domain-containing protein [candidate division WOR-3 bacterium]
MKRIGLVLLTGAITLSAVQWDTQQITDDIHLHINPVLALDSHGHPRILYIELDTTSFESWLMLSSNETGSWDTEEVTKLSNEFGLQELFAMQSLDIDLDSEDNTYVVFYDAVSPEVSDIFMASDVTGVTGDFVVKNLTSDQILQIAPVIQIDADDQVNLVYIEYEFDLEDINAWLSYGRLEGGELASEFVTDRLWASAHQMGVFPVDFILDSNGTPHIFYTRDDYCLWHAEPSISHFEDWNTERLSDFPYGVAPSAASDSSGNLYVVYRKGKGEESLDNLDSLMYATNKSDSWQVELVTRTGPPFYEWLLTLPSLCVVEPGAPYIVWGSYPDSDPYRLSFSQATDNGWLNEGITEVTDFDEVPAIGHYFAIDNQGYGHLVYAGQWQIIYAKSVEPLFDVDITEGYVETTRLELKVQGALVRLNIPEAGTIHLDLYDASGRRIECITSGCYPAGEHTVPINSAELSRGVYFVRGQIGGHVASAKFVVTR